MNDNARIIAVIDGCVAEGYVHPLAPERSPSAISEAARRLELPRSTVYDAFMKREPRMISKGTSILTDATGNLVEKWDKTRLRGRRDDEVVHLPDPKTITKISTLYDQVGEVSQQWISERPADVARQEAWAEYAKALCEEIKPLPELINRPSDLIYRDDLCALFPVSDHHLGMLAWPEETGSAWDVDIAEKMLGGAIEHLVLSVPNCKTAVVAFLGDLVHHDSFQAVTPQNRNPLDADGRRPKIIRALIRTVRRVVEFAAIHHEEVKVIIEVGNHDPDSSVFLREALHNIYENEPRITVDTSPKHFHYFRHGKCLVGVHHGDKVKLEDLPLLMAVDRAQDWGETEHRMWLTGHTHNRKVLEKGGCIVESFRVLPPTDAWAASQGYRAGREMHAIVLHSEFGEVARHLVRPSMIRI